MADHMTDTTPDPAPTVVLVHGAFADASSFARLIPLLLDEGVTVVVPAVPNRGLLGDSAYIASVVRQIPGPVVLVGHSYGGAVGGFKRWSQRRVVGMIVVDR